MLAPSAAAQLAAPHLPDASADDQDSERAAGGDGGGGAQHAPPESAAKARSGTISVEEL